MDAQITEMTSTVALLEHAGKDAYTWHQGTEAFSLEGFSGGAPFHRQNTTFLKDKPLYKFLKM